MSELFSAGNDDEPFVVKIFTGEFEDIDTASAVVDFYEGLRSQGLTHREALGDLLEGGEITMQQYITWLSADQPPGLPSS